jgi:hypothetical protein
MAGTGDDLSTRWPKGPPIVMIGRNRSTPVVAIHKVGRKLAALPVDRFLSLNEALALAAGCLGALSLAAHDLTRLAYTGKLTTAVRIIWPNGDEVAFLLRPTFWQWFDVMAHAPFDVPPKAEWSAGVRGDIGFFVGRWHFFVGRRRFDRHYSTVVPSKPVPQSSPRERSPSEGLQKLILLSEEPQFEPAPKWRPERAEEWLKETRSSYPRKPGESKNKWAERLYRDHMVHDFGSEIPWSTWQTLRRYMNFKTRTKKNFDQDS